MPARDFNSDPCSLLLLVTFVTSVYDPIKEQPGGDEDTMITSAAFYDDQMVKDEAGGKGQREDGSEFLAEEFAHDGKSQTVLGQ